MARFFTAVFIAAVFVLGSGLLQAQNPCQNNPSCPWGPPTTITIDLPAPHCNATITYVQRICGGMREISIVNQTINDGCGGWDQLIIYHYNYSGLQDFITQGLLIATTFDTPPPCPASTQMLANVYTASCGIWLYCEYNLPSVVSYNCEMGWTGPPPHTPGTPAKVKSWKWQSCGTTCCRRVYSICTNSSGVKNISLVSKQQLTPCSEQGNYAKPCENGC
jgi:hypothetical protein